MFEKLITIRFLFSFSVECKSQTFLSLTDGRPLNEVNEMTDKYLNFLKLKEETNTGKNKYKDLLDFSKR